MGNNCIGGGTLLPSSRRQVAPEPESEPDPTTKYTIHIDSPRRRISSIAVSSCDDDDFTNLYTIYSRCGDVYPDPTYLKRVTEELEAKGVFFQ